MRPFCPGYFLLVIAILLAVNWSGKNSPFKGNETKSAFRALPLPQLTPLEKLGIELSPQKIEQQIASFTMPDAVIKRVEFGTEAATVAIATTTPTEPNKQQELQQQVDSAVSHLEELVKVTEADALPSMQKIETRFDKIAQIVKGLNLSSLPTDQQKEMRSALDEAILKSIESMTSNLLQKSDGKVTGEFQIQIAKLLEL